MARTEFPILAIHIPHVHTLRRDWLADHSITMERYPCFAASPIVTLASNTEEDDQFGWSVALAPGGETLAVGAHAEQGAGLGVDADFSSNAANQAGAVYVFQGSDADWAQRAYVKASNTNDHDEFGHAVALSHNPQMLVVAAPLEDGDTVGVGATLAEQASNDAPSSGAVYAY